MALHELRNRDVIRVERLQMPVGVDDGIDRLDDGGGSIKFVDQFNAGFLERHRNRTATYPQRPNARHGSGKIIG